MSQSELHDWQEDVCVHHCQLALGTLEQLPDSDAVVLLENHVHGVMDSAASGEESLTREPVP